MEQVKEENCASGIKGTKYGAKFTVNGQELEVHRNDKIRYYFELKENIKELVKNAKEGETFIIIISCLRYIIIQDKVSFCEAIFSFNEGKGFASLITNNGCSYNLKQLPNGGMCGVFEGPFDRFLKEVPCPKMTLVENSIKGQFYSGYSEYEGLTPFLDMESISLINKAKNEFVEGLLKH